MIICNHCGKPILYADSAQQDLHPFCIDTQSVAGLIIDYVEICEAHGKLDFQGFIELWIEANRIAVETIHDETDGNETRSPLPSSPWCRR